MSRRLSIGKSIILSKRIDGDGDDFIIVHLDGCTYPTQRRTDDVVPFRGTKKPIGTKGRDTIVFGWSSSNNLELPVGELPGASSGSGKQLKVGEVEGDEVMVEELQSLLGGGNDDNDENTAQNGHGPPGATAAATAAAAGGAAGSAGSTGGSSDGAGGIGSARGTGTGRTPPPPSSGTNGGATRRISPPADEECSDDCRRDGKRH